MRQALVLMIAVVVAACATAGTLHMSRWVGRPVQEAIRELGTPSDVYALPSDNQTRYSWLWVNGEIVGADRYAVARRAALPPHWCEYSLTTFPSGSVRAWQAKGPACRTY